MAKFIAIILIIIGAGSAYWGFQLSGSFSSQVTQALTGVNSDKEMTLYISGVAGFTVGLFLLLKE